MLASIHFLVECVDLCHHGIHIGSRLYIDHHLMRPISRMDIADLVHVMHRGQQQKHRQYNSNDSGGARQHANSWLWLRNDYR